VEGEQGRWSSKINEQKKKKRRKQTKTKKKKRDTNQPLKESNEE
jgi:hypothetical protein